MARPPRTAVAPLGLREHDLRALDDPTVHDARLLPEDLKAGQAWGAAPGGGVRWIVAGERVLTWPDGSVSATTDRLPSAPTQLLDVPERMGGGFLFAMGNRVWRSDAWLEPARPVLVAAAALTQLLAGLDRVYARTQQGALVAFDPRTGESVSLGPLPASPSVAGVAALDGWRAVAVADLRGPLMTLDAGATWRRLPLPIDAADVVPLDGAIAIGGKDAERQSQWWEVRADGHVGRLASAANRQTVEPSCRACSMRITARTFEQRPLVAAIEDGWPLSDGSAVVARDGFLGRVRLSDGAVLESVPEAVPLRQAVAPATRSRSRARATPARSASPAASPTAPLSSTASARPEGGWSRCAASTARARCSRSGNGALAARGEAARPTRPARGSADDPRRSACCPPGGAWTEMKHFRGDRRRPRAALGRAGGRARRDGAPAEGRRPVDGAPDGHGRRQVRARPGDLPAASCGRGPGAARRPLGGRVRGAPAGRRRRLGRCRGVGHRDRNRARRDKAQSSRRLETIREDRRAPGAPRDGGASAGRRRAAGSRRPTAA